MTENKITSTLNEILVNLCQSVNIDYLAIIKSDGKEAASMGDPGDICRADLANLLNSYFNKEENFLKPGEVDEIRVMRQGMAECFVIPINGAVQLVAMASIERPSVLIRSMLTELHKARKQLVAIVESEWKEADITTQINQKKSKMIKEDKPKSEDSFESLLASSGGGAKEKEASKYWDNATLEEQELPPISQTISFEEAKRSGLVPDEKK